jgi:hypothetical protein
VLRAQRASLALAALLAGCGSVAPVVPVVVIAPAAEPAAEPPAEEERAAEVPFLGTYPRYAVASFKDGEAFETLNAAGTSSLTIERGRVKYEQRYEKLGRERHVVQVYTFDVGAVRRAREAYDIQLVHKSIEGNVPEYSPDSGSPRLVVRKRPWGWEAVLWSVDTSHVVAGHAFGEAPPGEPPPDATEYTRRLGARPR